MTVSNSTLTGNSAQNGGGIGNYSTGGIILITNSTLSNNTAAISGYGGGGGIYNAFAFSTLTVSNSTCPIIRLATATVVAFSTTPPPACTLTIVPYPTIQLSIVVVSATMAR